MSECIFDDEWDEDLEEDLFPILMTRNEVLFLDDNMTMLVEREGAMNETVTTMRMLIPSAQLPAPFELIEKIGMRGLHAGPIENSIATEAMTSVLITINRHYKVADSGFRITGDLVLTE